MGAEHMITRKQVALKVVEVENDTAARRAVREYKKMHELNHASLVRALDCFVEPMELGQQRINIVMEYCEGGDLAGYLRRNRPLDEAKVCSFLVPLAEALQFVHMKALIHRDVKPGNMLLMSDGRLKLGDL